MNEATPKRSTLIDAAEAIAPLGIPGCNELAREFDSIAHSKVASPAQIHRATVLAVDVRNRLRADTDPSRWLIEFSDGNDVNYDLIAALVSERVAQTQRVQNAIEVLQALTPIAA